MTELPFKPEETPGQRRARIDSILKQHREENPSLSLQDKLVEKIGRQKHMDSHTMALEACLLSFGQSLSELRPVQAKILHMRKKVCRSMYKGFRKKKLRANYQDIAEEGRNELNAYWESHAQPIVIELQKRYERLENQLASTHMHYQELAEVGFTELAAIIEEHSTVKAVSDKAAMYSIILAWKTLLHKVKTVFEQGEQLLPAIEHECHTMRSVLHASIAPQHI